MCVVCACVVCVCVVCVCVVCACEVSFTFLQYLNIKTPFSMRKDVSIPNAQESMLWTRGKKKKQFLITFWSDYMDLIPGLHMSVLLEG